MVESSREDSRIQILLAVFSGAQYLEEQIESLRAQTYSVWELLISDDGSSDGSLEIIDYYCNLDSRIYLVLDGIVAGSAKRNFFNLLGLAKADYVMFCDQDDVWDENKIEVTLNRMREVESRNSGMPILVSTDLRVVDQNQSAYSGHLCWGGARALCESYDKGLAMDDSTSPAKRLANVRLSVEKQKAIDKLFAKMGL